MDETKNVIEIKNITKDYGDFKLDNVSFNVTTGSVCGFIGQNGAGNIVFIEMNGKKLVHLGDTYVTEQLRNDLKELGKIDSIMLPINGRDEIREAQGIIGNLNCEEAAELAAYLRPDLSIPTHFDMVVGNTADPAVFKECLNEIMPESRCWIPTLMEEYNLI